MSEAGYICVTSQSGDMFDKLFKRLSYIERLKVCLATAKLVKEYHSNGYLCLDIKPSNIFILNDTYDFIQYIDYDSVIRKKQNSKTYFISSTPNWSAPEQHNPYEYNLISEKSDIFTLGEMVFYSLFERHSNIWEHRSFSNFSFEEIRDKKFSSNLIHEYLTKLFRGTLLSSVNSRFSSVDDIIFLLKKIVSELTNKYVLISGKVYPDPFFVGRAKEIREIDTALLHNDRVCVYGIDGIGKSEIVKNYAFKYCRDYDVIYLVYNSSLAYTICDNTLFQITEINRFTDETDEHYAIRKLDKLSEIINTQDRKYLMIFDEFNVGKNELSNNQIWDKIVSMDIKVLIITHNTPEIETAIEINNLSSEELVQVFRKHCGVDFDDSQLAAVEKIIEEADNHTSLVELLAKHMSSSFIETPEKFYSDLVKTGIFGLKKNEVEFNNRHDNIEQHIRRIFDLDNLSNDEVICLSEMCLMPPTGLSVNSFIEFWGYEDNNAINSLICKGWFKKDRSGFQVIILNGLLKKFITNQFYKNEELSKQIFWKFRLAMLRNYDDIRYKENQIEWLVKNKYFDREQLEHRMTRTIISQAQYKMLCNTVAHEIISNKFILCVKIVLSRYLILFEKYGQYEFMLSVIDYLMNLFNEKSQADQPIIFIMKVKSVVYKERLGYDTSSLIQTVCELMSQFKNKSEEHEVCEIILAYLYLKMGNISQSKHIYKPSIKKVKRTNSYPELNSIRAGHLELLAKRHFSFDKNAINLKSFYYLILANFVRSREEIDNELNTSENSIYIAINNAKIHLIKNELQQAIEILNSIISLFVNNLYYENVAFLRAVILLITLEFNLCQFNKVERDLKAYMRSTNNIEYYDIDDMVMAYYISAYLFYLKNDEFNTEVQLGQAIYCDRKVGNKNRAHMIRCYEVNDDNYIYSIYGIKHKIVSKRSRLFMEKMGEVIKEVRSAE